MPIIIAVIIILNTLIPTIVLSANEIEEIKKSRKGEKILITAHSGVIQAALSFYFTGNLEAYWKFRFDHGSMTKLCFDNSDFAFLEYVNRI